MRHMPDELSQRLMADAENYDVAAYTRSLLAPYRHVLLLMRAKFMSYEQIAITFARHGISIRPTAVGVFCRANFTKAEILRVRRERETTSAVPETLLPGIIQAPPAPRLPRLSGVTEPGRRGPRIARDDI
jgi:hypothetical protein